MDLPKPIAEIRKYRELTQEELAKQAGISKSAVSMYESGHRTPRLRVAKKLAEILMVKLDDITW